MYLRCENCHYITGDEGVPLEELLKNIETDGGKVDTTQGSDKIILTCPHCEKTGTIEKVA